MVEIIEVGDAPRARRFDVITTAGVVLTVNAALFLVIAVVGAPFVLYIFADDDTGTWNRMWPLVTWWLVAVVLGVACARVAVQSIGRGDHDIRRSGAGAAFLTAAAITVLVATSIGRAPLLAAVGALFVLANVGAGVALLRAAPPAEEGAPEDENQDAYEHERETHDAEPPEDAAGPVDRDEDAAGLADQDGHAAGSREPSEDAGGSVGRGTDAAGDAEPDEAEHARQGRDQAGLAEEGEPVAEAAARETVELPARGNRGPGRAAPAVTRRRMRRAALVTLTGVRLPRRPRR